MNLSLMSLIKPIKPLLKLAKDKLKHGRMVKLVNTADLKSAGDNSCQFKSDYGHHNNLAKVDIYA